MMVRRILAAAPMTEQVETPATNLQVDDLVLIKEDCRVPTAHWPMDRVVATYPGKDGLIRVVSIQMSKGNI